MAESSGDNGYVAILTKRTGEGLFREGIASKECLATFAGDGIEIVAKGFITTDHATL